MATFNEIKSKLNGYKNKQETAAQIVDALAKFNFLKPSKPTSASCADEARFNDKCVCLVGTIPVHVGGSKYFIPVSIQVMLDHPKSAPHVYVKPTPVMDLVLSDMVNRVGRVTIPSLSEWNKDYSNLNDMLQVMSMMFADKCPVQAKITTTPLPQYPTTPLNRPPQATPAPPQYNARPSPSLSYTPAAPNPTHQNYYPPQPPAQPTPPTAQAQQSDQYYQQLLDSERGHNQRMLADERARGDRAEKNLFDSQMLVGQTQQALHSAEQRVERLESELADTRHHLQEAEQARQRAVERERAVQRGAVDKKEQQFWIVGKDEIKTEQQQLGTGGWATVKVATFRHMKVAAKYMHQVIISDYNRELFVREMNMAARMRHPNIVQFIGANIDGEAVILTELMPTSLRAQYAKQMFTYPQIMSISEDVAKGLNYLHLIQPDPIIHRDISSANVLLEPLRDNKWRAKICDCGSANFAQRTNTAGPGNPTYAAPESETPKLQSPKMDVYSYGILLLETNTQRFPDPRTRELLFDMLGHRPEMVALIRHCMEVDANDRPSMEDVLVRLEDMEGRYKAY